MAAVPPSTRRFRIDSDRSRLGFVVTTTLHPLGIEATKLSGVIDLDTDESAHPVAAQLVVPIRSMRSGAALRDRELWRQTKAKLHPELVADLVSAERAPGGAYVVDGTITFMGTTRSVGGTVAVDEGEEELHVVGETVIDVRDFGLTPTRVFGLSVRPHVEVVLDLIATVDGQSTVDDHASSVSR